MSQLGELIVREKCSFKLKGVFICSGGYYERLNRHFTEQYMKNKCFAKYSDGASPAFSRKLWAYHLFKECHDSVTVYDPYNYVPETRSPVLPEPIGKACLSDQAIIRYLNREDVQRAIHVDADRFAAPDNSWALCLALKENYLQYDYNYNSNHEHFKTLLENKIAVALYNGDAKFTCYYSGAKMFV